MSLKMFLKQTCTVTDGSDATIVDGNVVPGTTVVYTDIPCFMYQDKRKFNQNERAIEDQKGKMTLAIERDKTNVSINDTVVVTDPDVGLIGTYSVERVDVHRSFTGIGAISLILNKIEDGEN